MLSNTPFPVTLLCHSPHCHCPLFRLAYQMLVDDFDTEDFLLRGTELRLGLVTTLVASLCSNG